MLVVMSTTEVLAVYAPEDTPMSKNGVYDWLLTQKQLSNSTTYIGVCSLKSKAKVFLLGKDAWE